MTAGREHPRRRSRILAMQALYQLDMRGDEVDKDLDSWLLENEPDLDTRQYARQLIRGTWEHRPWLDGLIGQVSQNWDLTRIGAVERAVIRLAVHEMLAQADPPAQVVINEAIELAKTFGDKDSGGFVNGVLDAIWKRHRDLKPAPAPQTKP
jgi:transcription antitermination factor NusB